MADHTFFVSLDRFIVVSSTTIYNIKSIIINVMKIFLNIIKHNFFNCEKKLSLWYINLNIDSMDIAINTT